MNGLSFADNKSAIPYPHHSCVENCQEVKFQGVVLERLPSAGIWCGSFATYQGVRFKITKILEGPITENEIIVFYPLVSSSLLFEDTPVLSTFIFRVGRKLMIKAGKTSAGEYVATENASNVTKL